MKEQFVDWTPGTRITKALLHYVQSVIDEYSAQGYQLTLRQLYYQLVARDIIPNRQSWYKRLGELVTNARYGGLIDWTAIVDRGRAPVIPQDWRHPGHILDSAIASYRLNRWADQDYYVEVWCEKDALGSVLEPIADRFHVPFMANRGYSSSTALYDAAQRFREVTDGGRQAVVIYLGDHDPSGLDMSRDIDERLATLSRFCEIENLRLALNMEQVKRYQPPPNPTKLSDSRAPEYVAEHGVDSWELDALEPQVLDELVSSTIEQYLDTDKWDATLEQEEADKDALAEAAEKVNLKRNG